MSKQRSSTARSKGKSGRSSAKFRLDPYFACLIFAGMGVGTFSVDAGPRLVLLWMTLLILWLAYREGQKIRLSYRFSEVGQGLLVGLLVGVPLMAITFQALAKAVPILYVGDLQSDSPDVRGTTIFATFVLLAPLAEELFFRDVLQRERGLWIATVLYAAAGFVLFLPTAGSYPVVLLAVSGATGVLGILYGFLHARYGLTVAMTCHATVNLALLWAPAALSHLELFAG